MFLTYLLGEKSYNRLSAHEEGSVSGLPVGPLSVLSHYTSIEF